MEVEFGKEALKFENGAFSYFGVPAIMPAGTNTPFHHSCTPVHLYIVISHHISYD